MAAVNPAGESMDIPVEHQMEIRVRYQETDAQGRVPVSYTHLTLPTILLV